MKILICVLFTCLPAISLGEYEVKNYDRSATTYKEIKGSSLWRRDSYSIPAGSTKGKHTGCRIGYLVFRGTNHATGARRQRIDPVIAHLPGLEQDVYSVDVTNGWLKITKSKSGQPVASINLEQLSRPKAEEK